MFLTKLRQNTFGIQCLFTSGDFDIGDSDSFPFLLDLIIHIYKLRQ